MALNFRSLLAQVLELQMRGNWKDTWDNISLKLIPTFDTSFMSYIQQIKSAANVCAQVRRTGNVDSCPFGSNCHFNHDLEAYLAQVHYILFSLVFFYTIKKGSFLLH